MTLLNNISGLNNISRISNISINNLKKSHESSSEKKRKLVLKNRRFERRPQYVTNSSNSSCKKLSTIPYNFSENYLQTQEEPCPIVLPKGIEKLRNELDNHFHNRHMSNPVNFISPLNKRYSSTNAKATSRLVLNKKNLQSRVSEAYHQFLIFRMMKRQIVIH